MNTTTEFDILVSTLLWGTLDESDATIVPGETRGRIEDEYSEFCDSLPEWIDPEESCLTGCDCYEQLAYDYIMTRMGHGVGFWEKSDWEEKTGEELTRLCKQQGTLETYVEDGKLYIF